MKFGPAQLSSESRGLRLFDRLTDWISLRFPFSRRLKINFGDTNGPVRFQSARVLRMQLSDDTDERVVPKYVRRQDQVGMSCATKCQTSLGWFCFARLME